VFERRTTKVFSADDVTARYCPLVGFKIAVIAVLPVVDGFQAQVAVKEGALPVVDTAWQLEMRLPLTKNLTFPATSTEIVTFTDIPLAAVAANEGTPILATSATFVIVIEKVLLRLTLPPKSAARMLTS
jgi:hypothetical protein